MQLAYIRVSTAEQNEQRQIEAMEKYNIEKWFTEKVSAKDTHRPKLQELLEFAREGDTIHIHDFVFCSFYKSNYQAPCFCGWLFANHKPVPCVNACHVHRITVRLKNEFLAFTENGSREIQVFLYLGFFLNRIAARNSAK